MLLCCVVERQPSPTTGSYYSPPFNQDLSFLTNSMAAPTAAGGYCDSLPFFHGSEHPAGEVNNLHYFKHLETQDLDGGFLNLPSQQLPIEFELPVLSNEFIASASIRNDYIDVDFLSPADLSNAHTTLPPSQPNDHITSQRNDHMYIDGAADHVMEEEKRASSPPMGGMRTTEDGYNWRKYGQKQVKGSEFPRSYYKCTHPNCEMRKQVERTHDGQITEIVYKGNHNHPQPMPNRRLTPDSAFAQNEMDAGEGCGGGTSRGKNEGLDRALSEPILTELSPTGREKRFSAFDSSEAAELASPLHNHAAEDDEAVEENMADANEVHNDATDLRRAEDCMVEPSMSSRGVREQKIVVEIETEVDILDDGYRWRKYGQKVVKGNPNPRSYYKCTTPGCLVRKHVERAPDDNKCVVTTYEGKHNHEVPAAKNSSNASPNAGHLSSAHPVGQPSHMPLAGSAAITMPAQAQFQPPPFESKPYMGNGFSAHSLPGNFGNDVSFGASSMYPMLYGSFGLAASYPNIQRAGLSISRSPILDSAAANPMTLHYGFDNHRGGGVIQTAHPGDENDPTRRGPKQDEANDEPADDS
uniref:WRKY domain-containing protein n=1 Tax=Kalanchoe fedtschenkoi TaxID=63787 RepID=A0A7N1A9M6_KALFE